MNAWPEQNDTWTAGRYLLVFLSFLVVAAMGIHTIAHGDFWTHLAVGRWIAANGVPRTDALSFSMAGQPWINPSWLYDRILFGLWNVMGAKGLILLHAIVVVGTFAALVPVMKKWAGGLSISLAILLGVWMIGPRYQIGPHLWAFLFAAIFLSILSSHFAAWKLAGVIVLQVLWANMDASFLLGPAICAVFAIERFAQRNASDNEAGWSFGAAAGLTVGCLIATLINPYHVRLWQVVSIPVLRQSPAVREWVSPFAALFPESLYSKKLLTLALVIGAGGLLAERRRLPLAVTTLAIVSAFVAVVAIYHVAFFAVLALPFLALSLEAIGGALISMGERAMPSIRAWGERLVGAVSVAAAGFSLLLFFTNIFFVATGSAAAFGVGVNHNVFPSGAIELLSKAAFPARAFNMPADGGYLLWRLPERPVFSDTRPGVYDGNFFQLGSQCLAGQDEAWKTLDEKWGVAAAVLNCAAPSAAQTARTLLLSQQWVLAFFDGVTAVLLRNQESVCEILADEKIRDAGLQALERERQAYARALGGYVRPPNSASLIGAGNFYMTMGRYKEAAVVYELLTRGAPEMAAAWINLGVARLQLGQVKEAEVALTQATRLAPKHLSAWLQLSEVYARLNDSEAERAALRRAQRINAAQTRAFVESRGRKME